MQKETRQTNLPGSALDVLKQTSEEFNQLERSNRKVAYRNLTVTEYREALVKRTQNIIELPARLLELEDRNIAVSPKIIYKAKEFSQKAQEALDSQMASLMHNLLIPNGSKKGDSNELDQLIKDLENS